MSALLAARASWLTYRYRSAAYFARRRRAIFAAAFLLVPLATVPELLLSPILIMGDDSADIRLKVGAFLLVSMLWSAWAGLNRPFQAHAAQFGAISVIAPPRFARLNAAVSLAIGSWPLFPLLVGVAFVGREDRLPWHVGALLLAAATGVFIDVQGWRCMRQREARIRGGASRLGVLGRHVVVDTLPLGKPWLATRYLFTVLCATCGFRWSGESEIGATGVLCGAATMIVWVLRGAADALHAETRRLAPILSTTRSFHTLCTARLFVLSTLASTIVLMVGVFVSSSLVSVIILLSGVIGGTLLLALLRLFQIDRAADWIAVCSPLMSAMAISA